MLFASQKNDKIVNEFDDNDYVKLCPSCSFPNEESSNECLACEYPFEDSDAVYALAKDIVKCPDCGYFTKKENLACGNCNLSFLNDDYNDSRANVEKFVIVCPNCSMKNEANISHCLYCGVSLEDEILFPQSIEKKEKIISDSSRLKTEITISFYNKTIAKSYRVLVKKGEEIRIGRYATLADVLSKKDYVSGEHFILSYHDNSIWIRDISSNGTFINGIRLDKYKESKLDNNSEIVLGADTDDEPYAAYFLVSY